MSRDEGETWEELDQDYFAKKRDCIVLSNGDVIQVKNPSTKDIKNYENFPNSVNEEPIGKQKYKFYYESELPSDFKGVYFQYWNSKIGKESLMHASLNDPGLLRYAMDDMMPVVWWGNIKELNDGSLLSGVYGGYYQNRKGEVLMSGIQFYKSKDGGYSWDIVGKIPFYKVGGDCEDLLFDGSDGYNEPTFEILSDNTYLCVMRNSSWSIPMHMSFSRDEGKTWSTPKPITPNGVKPKLTLLGNGVLVLGSGRPGIQLRFNVDGDGDVWSEPIEMMSFVDEDGKYVSTRETCGYSNILAKDDNTFYFVYSDFTTRDNNGNLRKSILFRKVEVITRK